MISTTLIQETAETLMEKAAIEIPQDYLEGLKGAASTTACSSWLPPAARDATFYDPSRAGSTRPPVRTMVW